MKKNKDADPEKIIEAIWLKSPAGFSLGKIPYDILKTLNDVLEWVKKTNASEYDNIYQCLMLVTQKHVIYYCNSFNFFCL